MQVSFVEPLLPSTQGTAKAHRPGNFCAGFRGLEGPSLGSSRFKYRVYRP